MQISTPAFSLDAPVPPGPSTRPSDLEMAAAAPLVRGETGADRALRTIGSVMIAAGTLAMLGGVIAGAASQAVKAATGSIVAAAIFAIIIGLAIRFPTMLQDGTMTEDLRPAYSCTRVVLLLVVSAFVVLTVKAGWSAEGLAALKIDPSWALILGVVLGGKVAQGLTEAGIVARK